MRAAGVLFLSKTAPLATTAADGTFGLTLYGMDRMGAHRVESWRLTYSGAPALAFWQAHRQDLRAGQPLSVAVERIMAFTSSRDGVFINAQASHIELAPRSHEACAQAAQAA